MGRKKRRLRRDGQMPRLVQPGAPPGTISADPQSPRPVIRVFGYGPDQFAEQAVEQVSQLRQFVGTWPVTWVNVDGLGDAHVLKELAILFGVHRLALEDILNLEQRAKVEVYNSDLFIVARMVAWKGGVNAEQVSMFVREGVVLTFQENYGDCLDHIRNRIRTKGGRIRQVGADYCAYALLDAIVDNYFPVLEHCGARLEELEEEVLARPQPGFVERIHESRRDLLLLRRALWPMREAVSVLLRESTPTITPDTRIYLRDCYDHTVQLLEITETYRELESSLMEIYLSTVNNRMNEIMKVLTIIATIFIPLTFIASIYGMNFHRMPELDKPWAYPAVLAVMVAIGSALLVFFHRKGWLRSLDARRKTMDRDPSLSEKPPEA